jgi:hypothetical protein
LEIAGINTAIIPLSEAEFKQPELSCRNHDVTTATDWKQNKLEAYLKCETNKQVLGRTNYLLPSYVTDRIDNDASNNSAIVSYVFVAAVTFLLGRCLAKIGGLLASRCLPTIEGIHIQTHRLMRGICKVRR